MVRRERSGREAAVDRAQNPPHRQCGKDEQYHGSGRMSPAHGASIPRVFAPESHSDARRRRNALPMTETELNVIAALAIIGLSNTPSTG